VLLAVYEFANTLQAIILRGRGGRAVEKALFGAFQSISWLTRSLFL
jgi:hypothetical protein